MATSQSKTSLTRPQLAVIVTAVVALLVFVAFTLSGGDSKEEVREQNALAAEVWRQIEREGLVDRACSLGEAGFRASLNDTVTEDEKDNITAFGKLMCFGEW